MRIEGMDASYKAPDYTTERQSNTPAPQQVHAEPAPTVGQEIGKADAGLSPESSRLVRMAVDKANRQMSVRDTSLKFEAHEKTGDMIVRIIDTNTKEVIREIPSEKILDMVANMLEMAGILVDERG